MLGHDVSLRTSAALHLIFYHVRACQIPISFCTDKVLTQALLLTIRPVMLHMAQLILSGKASHSETLYSSPLGKLCRTCTEAARRLLEVLMTLRQHKFISRCSFKAAVAESQLMCGPLVALFGFFDLDGMSSVSFIMILTEVLDSVCPEDQKIKPTPGLGEALSLMEHVASHGSKFAQQSLDDIRRTWVQLCARLNITRSTTLTQSTLQSPHADDEMGNSSSSRRTASLSNPLILPHAQHQRRTSLREQLMSGLDSPSLEISQNGTQSILADLDIREHMNHLWAPLLEDEVVLQDGDAATTAPNLYQNLYGNPQWQFTGEGMGDFAEFGRHIVNEYCTDLV